MHQLCVVCHRQEDEDDAQQCVPPRALMERARARRKVR